MTQVQTQIGKVIYNPETQSFEALVTFHSPLGRLRVPSDFPAALDTSFEQATRGLWQAALRKLNTRGVLLARTLADDSVTGSADWRDHRQAA